MFETKRRLDCSPILRALLPLPVPLFEMLLPDQQKRCTRSYKKKTWLFPQSCMPYCLEACASLWNAASWSRQAAWPETIFIAANRHVNCTIPKMFESKFFLMAKYDLDPGNIFCRQDVLNTVQEKWFCTLIQHVTFLTLLKKSEMPPFKLSRALQKHPWKFDIG